MDDADDQSDYTFSTTKLMCHKKVSGVKIDSLNAVFSFFTSSFNQTLKCYCTLFTLLVVDICAKRKHISVQESILLCKMSKNI